MNNHKRHVNMCLFMQKTCNRLLKYDEEKDQVIPNENTSCNNIWWIWMLILTYVYIFFKIFFKKIILNHSLQNNYKNSIW